MRRRSLSREEFRAYLLEQLEPLVSEYGATMEVGVGAPEIPYPYVIESGDELTRGGADAVGAGAFLSRPLAGDDRRRNRRRRIRLRPGAAARPVRRAPRRLFAAPPRPLHRLRLAGDAALGAAHQLSPLCRPVRAVGLEAAPCRIGRRRKSFCRATSSSTRRSRRLRRKRASRPSPGIDSRCPPIIACAPTGAGSVSSTSASDRRTPRPSPTTSRCSGPIAG